MESKPGSITGKVLNDLWGIGAKHALYSKDGKWFHILNYFPGALFDEFGYILFTTKEEFLACEYLQIQQYVHVEPNGICKIPGYIKVLSDVISFIPEEVVITEGLLEGRTKTISVNVYERNSIARHMCIAHYGISCIVCGFNFMEKYGELGKEYIHVHHIVPLNEIGEEYEIDPIMDL